MPLVLLAAWLAAGAPATRADYQVYAVRYATSPQFPLASLVIGAPGEEKVDIALAFWVVRGGGRTLLIDSGFHQFTRFPSEGRIARIR